MQLRQLKSDLIAGFVTSLFSVPEGMAYAKLAGVDPVYGLYSGIVATIAASMTVGTPRMISTLTSAIALSTASVFHVAEIPIDRASEALFTLTFLVGVIMLALGLLRLGKLVNFVSNAVMTGFICGASLLILIGELGDLVGVEVSGPNKLAHIGDWLRQLPHWHWPTALVGFGSAAALAILQRVPGLERLAAVLVLILGTLLVYLSGVSSIKVVSDIANVKGTLPQLLWPEVSLMGPLALGAVSVALVALIQGAGVSSAIQGSGSSKGIVNRDFIGQGIGNLLGGLFQSMATGGSLSRTAVSVNAGASSRFAGVCTGIWLMGLIYVAATWIGRVPLASMAGILTVVAIELMRRRVPDLKLVLASSKEASGVMLLTLVATLFIHLQWAIFVGAGLSVFLYVYTSATDVDFHQLVKDSQGYYEEQPLPPSIPSDSVSILEFSGALFFAEVPVVRDRMPSIETTRNAVIIWRLRGVEDVSSTFLKWLASLARHLQKGGNALFLAGVRPHVHEALQRTHLVELIPSHHIFDAQKGIGMSLDQAMNHAQQYIGERIK